jgi:hypothetical protein
LAEGRGKLRWGHDVGGVRDGYCVCTEVVGYDQFNQGIFVGLLY